MCGILGVVNIDRTHENYRAYCEEGAIVGQLRGWDSTGLFQVNLKGGFETYKLPVQGEHFIQNKGAQKRLNKVSGSLATIIHNRAATKGDISQENAHPFWHMKKQGKQDHYVVGVHNGTLWGGDFKDGDRKFEVDSDFLMYTICRDGAPEALKNTQGSYAVVWYENDWGLRIATNAERPLFWGYVKNRNAMLLASEAGMMWWLAERNRIALETIVSPEKNKIYKFDLRGDVRKFEVEAIPEKAYPRTGWENASNFPHGQRSAAGPSCALAAKTTSSTNATENGSSSDVGEDFFKKYKLKGGDTVPFQLLGEPTDSAGYVEGMIETEEGEVLAAAMYGVNPAIIRHLRGCEWATVQVRTYHKKSGEPIVVVSHPMTVVSTDEDTPVVAEKTEIEKIVEQKSEFAGLEDSDEFPIKHVSGMYKGPKGHLITLKTFTKLTEDGCMRCTGIVNPSFHENIEWVNDGTGHHNAICHECVAETRAQNEARKLEAKARAAA